MQFKELNQGIFEMFTSVCASSEGRLYRTLAILTISTLSSTATAGTRYQAGELVSITDSRSNRAVSNSQTGSVVTVTDVEYR